MALPGNTDTGIELGSIQGCTIPRFAGVGAGAPNRYTLRCEKDPDIPVVSDISERPKYSKIYELWDFHSNAYALLVY